MTIIIIKIVKTCPSAQAQEGYRCRVDECRLRYYSLGASWSFGGVLGGWGMTEVLLRRFTGLPTSFRGSRPSSFKLTTGFFW